MILIVNVKKYYICRFFYEEGGWERNRFTPQELKEIKKVFMNIKSQMFYLRKDHSNFVLTILIIFS